MAEYDGANLSGVRLKLFLRSCIFEKPGKFYLSARCFGVEQRTDVTEESGTTAKFKQRLLVWPVPSDASILDAKIVVGATQLLFSRGDRLIGEATIRLRDLKPPPEAGGKGVEHRADVIAADARGTKVGALKVSVQLDDPAARSQKEAEEAARAEQEARELAEQEAAAEAAREAAAAMAAAPAPASQTAAEDSTGQRIKAKGRWKAAGLAVKLAGKKNPLAMFAKNGAPSAAKVAQAAEEAAAQEAAAQEEASARAEASEQARQRARAHYAEKAAEKAAEVEAKKEADAKQAAAAEAMKAAEADAKKVEAAVRAAEAKKKAEADARAAKARAAKAARAAEEAKDEERARRVAEEAERRAAAEEQRARLEAFAAAKARDNEKRRLEAAAATKARDDEQRRLETAAAKALSLLEAAARVEQEAEAAAKARLDAQRRLEAAEQGVAAAAKARLDAEVASRVDQEAAADRHAERMRVKADEERRLAQQERRRRAAEQHEWTARAHNPWAAREREVRALHEAATTATRAREAREATERDAIAMATAAAAAAARADVEAGIEAWTSGHYDDVVARAEQRLGFGFEYRTVYDASRRVQASSPGLLAGNEREKVDHGHDHGLQASAGLRITQVEKPHVLRPRTILSGWAGLHPNVHDFGVNANIAANGKVAKHEGLTRGLRGSCSLPELHTGGSHVGQGMEQGAAPRVSSAATRPQGPKRLFGIL